MDAEYKEVRQVPLVADAPIKPEAERRAGMERRGVGTAVPLIGEGNAVLCSYQARIAPRRIRSDNGLSGRPEVTMPVVYPLKQAAA